MDLFLVVLLESHLLSHQEHKKIVEECILITVNKRVPVIAGTGSNNTIEAIEYTQHAEKMGADGVSGSDSLL